MRSTTSMLATVMTTKSLRSMKLTSGTQTSKARIMILITKRTNITIILTTATATHHAPGTRQTTTIVEGTLTTTTRNVYTEEPANVQVTLMRPVNKDQLFKIQEILRNLRVYRDKLPKGQQPATGEYAKSFNKFHPTKVEINEATVDDVVKYGHLTKRSEAEMAEAIDIYKALGDDIYYGPEEQPAEPQQQQDQ